MREIMTQKVENLWNELSALRSRCQAEGRLMTKAEMQRCGEIQDEIKALHKQLTLEDRHDDLTNRLKQSPRTPAHLLCAENILGDALERKESKTMKKQLRADSGPYKNETLGTILSNVRTAGTPGGIMDPRLAAVQTEARATGLSEGVGSEGGFLLPQNLSKELLATVWDEPDILSRVNLMPISVGNSLKIPAINETSRADGSRQGGVQAYWTGEAKAKTPSKPDFRMVDLQLKKLTGLC